MGQRVGFRPGVMPGGVQATPKDASLEDLERQYGQISSSNVAGAKLSRSFAGRRSRASSLPRA